MPNKQNRPAARLFSRLFSELTGFLIVLGLSAVLLLVLESTHREEARLKRELADWGARIAIGIGDRPPSLDDEFERRWARRHFATLKAVYQDLRAIRFVEVGVDGNVTVRERPGDEGGGASSLRGALPEELRATALEAVEGRKAGVVVPRGSDNEKGIAVFAPLGGGRHPALDAALWLDVDPSIIRRQIWKAVQLPVAAVGALCLLAIIGASLLRGRRTGGIRTEAVIAALACAIVALTFFFSQRRQSAAESNLIFHRLAERRANHATRLLRNVCTVKLETLASFIETRGEVDEREFDVFSAFLVDDPIVSRWEWVSAVPARELEQFVERMRSTGRPGFAVWQRDARGGRTDVGDRDDYYVVTFASPVEKEYLALGYDMGSEPVRRRAIEDSVAARRTLATDPVTLIQDAPEEKGLLVLRPVFRPAGGSLRGFVLARLALADLLSYSGEMSGDDDEDISIAEIYLAGGDGPPELLACSAPGHVCSLEGGALKDEDTFTLPLRVFGKTFIVVVHKGRFFDAVYPSDSGLGILVAGLLLAFAVFFLVSTLAGRGEALESLVRERTRTLRDSEKMLKEAQEIARLGSWVLDVPSGALAWSDEVYTLFGIPVGSPQTYEVFLDAVHPDDREALDAAYSSSVAEGLDGYEFEHRVINRETGRTIYLHELCRHYKDSAGRVVRSVGMVHDITERKLSEMALERAGEELAAANASLEKALDEAREMAQRAGAANVAKGQFLANVSHEIRTPLNGVIGMTDILEETPLTDEQREYVALLKSSGRHLLALINDVLDFSKLEAGKLETREEEFDLREFLDEIFAFGAARASINGLEFRGTVSHSAPSCVMGDRFRIRQILTNLLDNAVKFTAAGRITVAATSEGIDEDGRTTLRFSVADTGIGVSEGALGQLFAEFSQVDPSLTRKHGGTGLGLAISKELAELMGGEIGASSPSGLEGGGPGTEFWFTVKVVAISCLEVDAEPEDRTVVGPVAPRDAKPGGLKVLVAEDNAINRRVIAAILSGAGIRADLVEDGAKAVAAMEYGDYDAVFMDVQMPVMDGLDATREIRRSERARGLPPIPVIALTAHAMPGDRDRCMEAGMDEYVSKPIDRQVFLEALYRLVSRGGRPDRMPEERADEKSARVFTPDLLLKNLDGDAEAVAEILASFTEDLSGEVAGFRERVEAGDAAGAARHAHTLKGAAGGVGGEEVRELAFRAEMAGKEGDLESLLLILPDLERAFADLGDAIARYLIS